MFHLALVSLVVVWGVTEGKNKTYPKVVALDPEDGSVKWFYKTKAKVTKSSPAVAADDTVYIGGSKDHALYAVKPGKKGGEKLWTYTTGGKIHSSPAIAADGTIHIGSKDHYLYSVSSKGKLQWKFKTGGKVTKYSPALATDGTVYVGSSDRVLYAIKDGEVMWMHAFGKRANMSTRAAVHTDGTILLGVTAFKNDSYISSGGDGGGKTHKIVALNPGDGSVKWEFETEGKDLSKSSPAVASDGTVYIGGNKDNTLYAVKDGVLQWKFVTNGTVESSPVIATDGFICIGSEDKVIYALQPNGSLKWSYTAGGEITKSSPAIAADGTVYIGSKDRNVYAIRDGVLKWTHSFGYELKGRPAIASDGTVVIGVTDNKKKLMDRSMLTV